MMDAGRIADSGGRMGRDEFQAAAGRRLRLGKVMLDAGGIADSR